MKSGLVLVNKSEGMTSQRVVNTVKRLFDVPKAGHTGTLDPLATGVLPVLIGRAVKAGEYLLCADKHYIATLRLGLYSDTEDITGTLTPTNVPPPPEEAVQAAVAAFVGEIDQVPPMYSALKMGGQKLVDLARRGVVVERAARRVQVFSMTATRLSACDYRLQVHCSKGTYIRTLCADIGASLGCGGVMASLCRAEAAGYALSETHTLEQLSAMTAQQRDACILPTESLFAALPPVTLPPFFARLARAGVEIYLKKLGREAACGERFRLYDEGGFFALGEVRAFADGLAIKPIKQFDV